MRKFLVLAAFPLAACTLPPEGIEEEQIAFYDVAVASLDCTLIDEGDYLATAFQTGLTREQVTLVTQYKIELEDMRPLPAGGYKLMTGPCETNAETPAS